MTPRDLLQWAVAVAGALFVIGCAACAIRAALAAERRQLEAMLPANLRYVKGWPQRVPTIEEAATIADVRGRILAVHGLDTPYRTADQVRARIGDLYEAARGRLAA